MPDVVVHPHGERWAVAETGGGTSPLQEFPTREAAESAARRLAGGGEVTVLEDDPTTLGGSAADAGGDERPVAPADGLRERERLRTEQGGL